MGIVLFGEGGNKKEGLTPLLDAPAIIVEKWGEI
jgi:hypothetical protein